MRLAGDVLQTPQKGADWGQVASRSGEAHPPARQGIPAAGHAVSTERGRQPATHRGQLSGVVTIEEFVELGDRLGDATSSANSRAN